MVRRPATSPSRSRKGMFVVTRATTQASFLQAHSRKNAMSFRLIRELFPVGVRALRRNADCTDVRPVANAIAFSRRSIRICAGHLTLDVERPVAVVCRLCARAGDIQIKVLRKLILRHGPKDGAISERREFRCVSPSRNIRYASRCAYPLSDRSLRIIGDSEIIRRGSFDQRGLTFSAFDFPVLRSCPRS